VPAVRPIRLNPNDKQLERIALRLAADGDWPGLCAMIRNQPPQSGYAVIQLLADAAPMTLDVAALIAIGGALELTIAGGILLQRALRFRGLGMAEGVSEEQWELYMPTLAHAQELLARANCADPELGLAAAWRVAGFVDSATEEEKDEAEIALRRARSVPLAGLSRLITMRSEKWGGSHEEMWRVVSEYARTEAPATLALLAKAHFEQQLWLEYFDERPEAKVEAAAYFSDRAVLGDLRAASSTLLAAEVETDAREILFADNAFASTFWRAGKARLARPHLQRMGGHIESSLWLVESPRLVVNLARMRAMLLPV
jgi:hypothetical protein